jgi:putative aldouronate transport system substrate-binding protein
VETSESTVESATEEVKSLFNEAGTLPIVNEPVTLKVLTQDNPSHAVTETEDKLLWEWLEEKTGIHFEVESYVKEELKNKLPLIMATPNEMPDIFWRCDFTSSDVLMYGQEGQLLQLDDLIAEYGPNIQECFETLDYAYGAAASADGNIYSLPAYNGEKVIVDGHYMSGSWLKNIGKETPTTFEELYDVFKAIQAHDDANGDGIKGNEICWSGRTSNFRRAAHVYAGVNCYWPWNGVLFDAVDDEVYFVNTSDQYREMLRWLNKFWEEGMIDHEVFTQTGDEYNAKQDANRIFLKNGCFNPEKANWNGIEGDFKPVPITLDKDTEPLVTLGAPYQTDIGAISAYTEYPEICMLVLDYMFTEEGSLASWIGQEGIDYKVVTDKPFIIEPIDNKDRDIQSGPTSTLTSRWVRDEWVQPKKTQIERDEVANAEKYGKFAFQNYLKFTTEEADAVNTISADLGLFCDDYFVGFINGTYDIEKDWDKFVEECNSMKLDELTAVYQAAYNRYFGIE